MSDERTSRPASFTKVFDVEHGVPRISYAHRISRRDVHVKDKIYVRNEFKVDIDAPA